MQNVPQHATEPAIRLDPLALDAGNTCVQCGLCLPSCPTYLATGNEADSPRGRIKLMLDLHDGHVPLTDKGKTHLDRCLDCRGCETACPSGVVYHRLIEDARDKLVETGQTTPAGGRLARMMFFHVLTQPTRLRWSLLPVRLMQKVGLYPLLRMTGLTRLLPPVLRRMERMLDPKGPLWPGRLPEHSRGGGMDLVHQMLSPKTSESAFQPKLTVGFFEGCVGQVMYSQVNRKAAELICAAGADVVAPRSQICCGAIHRHNGDTETALAWAKQNIDTFLDANCDRIITTVAGDGAMLRQYAELFRDDPAYKHKAEEFSSRVRDVTEVLAELKLPQLKPIARRRVTYHDACHLKHGQKVDSIPRQLLAKVPGLELVELPEADICCGAAGTYNLTQPEMANSLAGRKLDNVAETGAVQIAVGNVGCASHLRAAAEGRGQRVELVHPVEILHESVFGRE